MLELIHNAKHSVALESYIFRSDEVGHRFSDALRGASARGAQVRVITDWIGARGTSHKFLNELRKHGVDVRVFNPPGLRPWLGPVPPHPRKRLLVAHTTRVTGGHG